MRRMDTTKLLICGVATALVASHANEDQRPECGIEIAGKPCAWLEQHPAPLHLELGYAGSHPFNAIPGLAIPGLAHPGVGYYGPEPEAVPSYARDA
jgi:hypothetical protein